jgi:hypothetical protein
MLLPTPVLLTMFAYLDAATGGWLTPEVTLEGSAWYSRTWPYWGWMRHGVCYRPPKLGHAIRDAVSSSSPGPLLHTPLASDAGRATEPLQRRKAAGRQIALACQLVDLVTNRQPDEDLWGHYRPAINHWAAVIGRDAPYPVVEGPKNLRANPVFVEWVMGLPAGWVTNPNFGLSHTRVTKALGNGVVPAQAVLALTLLRDFTVETTTLDDVP